MTKLEYDRFEAWFRSTCTCLEEHEITELLKVDLQETVDTNGFVFENSGTQHDWEVWQAASSKPVAEIEQLKAMLNRAVVGYGIRNDFSPPRTALQVECLNSRAITDWLFDSDGRLSEVMLCDD